jgi:competence protein ComEC
MVGGSLPSVAFGLATFLSLVPNARAVPSKPLTIYFIDAEGGQATLFVTPDGQSILTDVTPTESLQQPKMQA